MIKFRIILNVCSTSRAKHKSASFYALRGHIVLCIFMIDIDSKVVLRRIYLLYSDKINVISFEYYCENLYSAQ